jgi:hypothetical protein
MLMHQNGFQWSKQLPFWVFSDPNHGFCCHRVFLSTIFMPLSTEAWKCDFFARHNDYRLHHVPDARRKCHLFARGTYSNNARPHCFCWGCIKACRKFPPMTLTLQTLPLPKRWFWKDDATSQHAFPGEALFKGVWVLYLGNKSWGYDNMTNCNEIEGWGWHDRMIRVKERAVLKSVPC